MSTVEFEAEKALLARDILNIEDLDILNEAKELLASIFHRPEKEEFIEKAEILKQLDKGFKDIKAGRVRPVSELFKEL